MGAQPTAPARPAWWLGGPVALAVLVQLALFATATAPGLAGTSDSAYYLHAARTLHDTGQLLNPDGTAYRYWPPLYPVLLGACGSLASTSGRTAAKTHPWLYPRSASRWWSPSLS